MHKYNSEQVKPAEELQELTEEELLRVTGGAKEAGLGAELGRLVTGGSVGIGKQLGVLEGLFGFLGNSIYRVEE